MNAVESRAVRRPPVTASISGEIDHLTCSVTVSARTTGASRTWSGGMNKVVFSHDKAAVDAEVERLRPLIEMGGYLPCPDHRIASDAKFDNVCYYTERMRKIYG